MAETTKCEIDPAIREMLADWFDPSNRAVCELAPEPKGFRDLMWCDYLNEPAILQWKDGKPDCPNCKGKFEPSTHAFIGHVLKPRFV